MRFAFLLAPGLALIVVAGCGGSGTHTASPSVAAPPTGVTSSSASASVTPSPSATTPLLTGAAVKPGEVPPTEDPRFITDNQAGAITFAGYFYRALDWSIATTNPNLLRPISAPTCKTCQGYIHDIDAYAATRGHSEGARISAYEFAPAQGDLVQAEFVIEVTLTQQPQVFVNADGTRSTPAPPKTGPITTYLYMNWDNGNFVALGIG